MATAAGGEPASLAQAEGLILKALKEHAQGLDDAQLQLLCKGRLSDQVRIDALNSLIQKSRLQVLQKADGAPLFKAISEEEASKMRDLSYEEQLIYQAVGEAGPHGCLAFQFKTLIGQAQAQVNTLLRQMEKKQLIKSMKSVSKGNKKVYLLMDVEPSVEVTGGLTGTANFELDRMEEVQRQVEAHARRKGVLSHTELLVFIKQLGLLQADQLRDQDIDQIVTAMLLDLRLEPVLDLGRAELASEDTRFYRAANWAYAGVSVEEEPHVAFTETPCGHCRLRGECGPQNDINPQTCEYMQAWLDMF